MSETLLVLAIVLGLALSGLLTCSIACEKFKFWPTPGNGTWQGLLFWGLFRGLNVTTLALAFVYCRAWQDFTAERTLGAALALLCFALYIWGLSALGRANVYCGRDGLVTGGIYAWTRNPQYATAIPAYLGLAIASSSIAVFAAASLLMLSYALMAFAEERWLEAAYGAEYRRYRQEVARFYSWRRAWALMKQEVFPPRRASEEPVSERPQCLRAPQTSCSREQIGSKRCLRTTTRIETCPASLANTGLCSYPIFIWARGPARRTPFSTSSAATRRIRFIS